MNTPTPLGKTYEQYEKELKEYKEINLSKVERVELASIKDFDKLAKESLLVKVYPVYQDLEGQAKELGVDLPKELSQEMNIIRSYIKSVDEDIKILKAII